MIGSRLSLLNNTLPFTRGTAALPFARTNDSLGPVGISLPLRREWFESIAQLPNFERSVEQTFRYHDYDPGDPPPLHGLSRPG